jgi:hypothetical protein
MAISFFWTPVVLQKSTIFAVTLFGVGEAKSAGWEVDMSKSNLACTLSLTSIGNDVGHDGGTDYFGAK